MTRFRQLLSLPLALLLALAMAVPVTAADRDQRTLERYAADTWRSFVAMVEPDTGLPADNIRGSLRGSTRSEYTSPTNIGMYFWAVLAARDLGLISSAEAVERLDATLTTVEGLERHEPSGQFWNWYSPQTGAKLTIWPENDNRLVPFASSVDNGWLASALLMVSNAVPQLRDRARAMAESMNFGCYYDANAKGPDAGAGLIRGGFWLVSQPASVPGDYCGMGETVQYTGHHYGAFNTEPRIASYIGIALGQIPAEHYFGGWRTFPDTCDWSWPETRPIGVWREYMGVDVFEGAYPYDDQLVVPTWGGSMFEALMVPLVVPEEEWGPTSWAVTHPLYVESQIEFGIEEAEYGYWGFSPSSHPAGGYREFGVDAIGMDTGSPFGGGYPADTERLTITDPGWDDPNDVCDRPADPIDDYGQGVVTPHAAFLALDFAPEAAMDNLRNLADDFDGMYGHGGFKDAVNVATGQVANRYLALDQGMVIAAIANELTDDALQDYLAVTLQPALQPLMAIEEFGAGRIAP
jgi:hypothetical protein